MSDESDKKDGATEEISEENRKRAISLLLGFCALHQASRLYDMNNKVVRKVLDEMMHNIQGVSGGREPVTLTTAGYSFFLNRLLVRMGYTEYKKAQQLKEIWGKLAISEVVFPADVTIEGMEEYATRFVAAIKDPSEVHTLTRKPWGGITSRMVLGGSSEEKEGDDVVCALAVRVYGGLMVLIRETIEQFKEERWTTLLRLKRALQVLVDKLEFHEGLLTALACTPIFRDSLASHLTNASLLSLIVGRRLGLDRRNLIALATAALFHDVTKVGLKPATLATLENAANLEPKDQVRIGLHWMNTMNHMVEVGGLKEETLPRLVVAFESQMEFGHDRLYPPGITAHGTRSVYSHIIALCDLFDSLMWRREGKRSLNPHHAMLTAIHKGKGRFEPALLQLFLQTLGLYPAGTIVRLNTGELAVVTEQDRGGDLKRPVVAVVMDNKGRQVKQSEEIHLVVEDQRAIATAEDAAALKLNPIAIFLQRDAAMGRQAQP